MKKGSALLFSWFFAIYRKLISCGFPVILARISVRIK